MHPRALKVRSWLKYGLREDSISLISSSSWTLSFSSSALQLQWLLPTTMLRSWLNLRCLMQSFFQGQCSALHMLYVPIFLVILYSPPIAALFCVLEVDLPRCHPGSFTFWLWAGFTKQEKIRGRKRGRSGCLVSHLSPTLPQTQHLLCPPWWPLWPAGSSFSMPRSLQAPATLFLDLPLQVWKGSSSPFPSSLRFHPLQGSSLLHSDYRKEYDWVRTELGVGIGHESQEDLV